LKIYLEALLVKVEEVDKGKQKGTPDAIVLVKLFINGVIILCNPKAKIFFHIYLSPVDFMLRPRCFNYSKSQGNGTNRQNLRHLILKHN